MLIGIAVGSSRLVYRGFYPMLVGFNSIPKVAIVPVLVIWFGIGTVPAVLTAFLMSFFPIAVNVATGLGHRRAGDGGRAPVAWGQAARHHRQGRAAARAALFLRLVEGRDHARLRRLGDLGVDRLEPRHRNHDGAGASDFRIALVFAGLIVTAVMGIAMYAAFAVLELRTTHWATRRMDFDWDD